MPKAWKRAKADVSKPHNKRRERPSWALAKYMDVCATCFVGQDPSPALRGFRPRQTQLVSDHQFRGLRDAWRNPPFLRRKGYWPDSTSNRTYCHFLHTRRYTIVEPCLLTERKAGRYADKRLQHEFPSRSSEPNICFGPLIPTESEKT